MGGSVSVCCVLSLLHRPSSGICFPEQFSLFRRSFHLNPAPSCHFAYSQGMEKKSVIPVVGVERSSCLAFPVCPSILWLHCRVMTSSIIRNDQRTVRRAVFPNPFLCTTATYRGLQGSQQRQPPNLQVEGAFFPSIPLRLHIWTQRLFALSSLLICRMTATAYRKPVLTRKPLPYPPFPAPSATATESTRTRSWILPYTEWS